jgi:hypothetical protein
MSIAADSQPTAVSGRRTLVWAVGLTIAFELLTVFLRYGLQLESTRDTASTVGRLTCGIRIHHSYIGGVMMLLACCLWDRSPRLMWWMLVIGLGLFFSDLIHHFLVLWPLEGDPQFHLVYPSQPDEAI